MQSELRKIGAGAVTASEPNDVVVLVVSNLVGDGNCSGRGGGREGGGSVVGGGEVGGDQGEFA